MAVGPADDGYAVFTALATVKALKDHGQPHGRIVILIECSEESGSRDLPHYINTYAARLGTPSLVICLDSGCGNYEQLWSTTSLRGLITLNLHVEVLRGRGAFRPGQWHRAQSVHDPAQAAGPAGRCRHGRDSSARAARAHSG